MCQVIVLFRRPWLGGFIQQLIFQLIFTVNRLSEIWKLILSFLILSFYSSSLQEVELHSDSILPDQPPRDQRLHPDYTERAEHLGLLQLGGVQELSEGGALHVLGAVPEPPAVSADVDGLRLWRNLYCYYYFTDKSVGSSYNGKSSAPPTPPAPPPCNHFVLTKWNILLYW